MQAQTLAFNFDGEDATPSEEKGNASDKILEVLRPVNLEALLSQIPACRAIIITGQKSMDIILTMVHIKKPAIGHAEEAILLNRHVKIYRMPSSSRAYPKPLPEKAAIYKRMFDELEIT